MNRIIMKRAVLIVCVLMCAALCCMGCNSGGQDEPTTTAKATGIPKPSGSVIELPEESFNTPDDSADSTPSADIQVPGTPVESSTADSTSVSTSYPTKTPAVTATATPTQTPTPTKTPTPTPVKTSKPSGGVLLPPDYL